MKKLWLLLILTIFITIPVHSQEEKEHDFPGLIGRSQIIHYNREEFNADPQFWTACEDHDGILYFGNNDGAIAFDGERWHKIFLPNNSSVRSLTVDENGLVYAGGYNELGVIKRDSTGRYFYESQLNKLQLDGENFENLWQAHSVNGQILFRSFQKIFSINNDKVTELPSEDTFIRSFVINNTYYIQDIETGILVLDQNEMVLKQVFPANSFGQEEIIGLYGLQQPDQFLALTRTGKILRLNSSAKSSTTVGNLFNDTGNNQVISSLLSGGVYYAGTLSSGIIAFNSRGEIFYNDRNFQRLQDKAVHNIFQQSNGNLWALLNKGLDKINLASPVSVLFDNASIYDVLIDENLIYLASNQGVFYGELPNEKNHLPISFQKIPGLEGQAWSITKFENDILVSHDKGLFIIDGGEANRINGLDGIWKVIPVKDRKSLFLACSYHGLYVVQHQPDGTWVSKNKIAGFDESSRDILAGDQKDTYWVCHGYKGVFRIKINDEYSRITLLEQYTDQNGIPSPFNINCFRWNGDIVFTTNNGIFKYNEQNNLFEPYSQLNSVLDSTLNTRKLFQQNGKTWFIQDDEAGYFSKKDDSYIIHKEPFLRFKGQFNRGMELIHPLDSSRVLLGTNNGLYLVNLQNEQANSTATTNITSVSYSTGQNILPLPVESHSQDFIKLPYNTNIIRIQFAAPEINLDDATQFSYMLKNVDDIWSSWQTVSYKEYNHLPPGKYTFRVKSRGINGLNGKETNYYFEIVPIWYQTLTAYIIYTLLGLALFALLVYWISFNITSHNKKAWKEEQKARKLLELELKEVKLQAEKDRMLRENELLEDDVIYKSKELANYTMLLIKKREIFSELRDELKELSQSLKGSSIKQRVRDLLHKLDQHMSNEDHLHVFETNFEKVHQDFFEKLRSLHPDLHQRELHLCAFVKMNLTNKEISPLLNISVRGVETARYRIRKKLDLEHEENLVEYLEALSPQEDANQVLK